MPSALVPSVPEPAETNLRSQLTQRAASVTAHSTTTTRFLHVGADRAARFGACQAVPSERYFQEADTANPAPRDGLRGVIRRLIPDSSLWRRR